MAQFTAQGRMKLLFNCDGVQLKLLRNGFAGGLNSFQLQKKTLEYIGSCTRLYYSLSKKSRHFNARASLKAREDGDSDESEDFDSEFETDDLASFRGLVLDISYRYCSSRENLTIDHVLPTAQGGEWTWENLVSFFIIITNSVIICFLVKGKQQNHLKEETRSEK
uniref:HNH domain-containing protein n=1 Tax=Manihot esculenta TaxID=3983 RepID=A0A2C9VAT1_MANES